MNDGSAAECAVSYNASDVGMEVKGRTTTILRWKAISWTRVIVDALLVAGILLASSSILSVR